MRQHGYVRPVYIPLVAVLLTAMTVVILQPHALAAAADKIAECASVEDDTARLECYDSLAGRRTQKTQQPSGAPVPEQSPKTASPAGDDRTARDQSVMSRQWDLDEANRAHRFVIRSYRPNYVLPLAYNTSPNMDASLDVDPNAKAQNTEVKFQISFKVKLWEDILGKDMDLWFAYTQLAFWQLYNSEFSAPFRETNYEPELLLNFRTNYDLLGLKGRIINLGLNHQSNGRSQPLSRSWNRIVANFGFERDRFNLLLKTWYRIPEKAKDDDNPDIDRYLGYGELWGYYFLNKHRFAAMVRNNLRPADNRGAIQLEWSFPLIERISGYVQYFNGYGESLQDYNKSVNRFSIGFMVTDW
ncbi:MAG TPA: phospholipase [Deltaproteobacteria bacterium]|nr:phospholipase [Deltaproteobacteria bacterium]